MATDIMDRDMLLLRKNRWSKAFDFDSFATDNGGNEGKVDVNRKGTWTIVQWLSSIAKNCIPEYQGFIDLWKALLLWEFGGGVVDYDWVPKSYDNKRFTELIQPHDQAILFMDLLSTSGSRQDRYTSILFVEPKHPLAYYLVLDILNRLTYHRHSHAIDWSFVTGSHALFQAASLFCIVDMEDFSMLESDGYLLPSFENVYLIMRHVYSRIKKPCSSSHGSAHVALHHVISRVVFYRFDGWW